MHIIAIDLPANQNFPNVVWDVFSKTERAALRRAILSGQPCAPKDRTKAHNGDSAVVSPAMSYNCLVTLTTLTTGVV
jgi:hypothetical protein